MVLELMIQFVEEALYQFRYFVYPSKFGDTGAVQEPGALFRKRNPKINTSVNMHAHFACQILFLAGCMQLKAALKTP